VIHIQRVVERLTAHALDACLCSSLWQQSDFGVLYGFVDLVNQASDYRSDVEMACHICSLYIFKTDKL